MKVYFLTKKQKSLEVSISNKDEDVLFLAAAYGQTPLDFAKFDLGCFLKRGRSHLFSKEDCERILNFVDSDLNKYKRIYRLL